MMLVRNVRGECGRCGRFIIRPGHAPTSVICECYRYCPICGREMEPYRPDLDPKTYRCWGELDIFRFTRGVGPSFWTVYICPNHEPPYYSSLHPSEVQLR